MNSSNVKNYKSRIRLYQCLAIVIRKEGCRGDPGDFWMYENGYLLFQGLLSSNSLCWWNSGLNGATKSLSYLGYISPGALLVGSEPCAIDIVKTAWERRVLQPPSGYQIVGLEEIDDCYGVPVSQTQWTPLPEAVCSVVLRLSRQGRPAGIETIREALILTFPHVSPPSEQALYDTLVQLTTEKKLYHTSNGYFIVTPERRRSRSHSRSRGGACNRRPCDETDTVTGKTMLMTTDEALVMVHGDMATIRDGNVTHQLIQTNLADVICGGNLSDKILYPRNGKQRNLTTTSSSSSSTTSSFSRSPDRRGSFRLWRSNRSRLRRSASTRTISKHYTADTTSSSTETSTPQTNSPPPRKESLLSRLFRKSRRSQINTFSAQFPPTEWFNSKAVHLHSIGTQTTIDKQQSTVPITHYLENGEIKPSRSATLPRRHYQRHLSTDLTIKSRDSSPTKLNYASLPRSNKLSMNNRENSKRTTNRNSLIKQQETSNQCDVVHVKTSQNKPDAIHLIDNNSGPSSIESQKSSTKTDSSINSGPSSLESHKTVINTKMNDVDLTTTTKKSNSFTLQVTTNQSKLNNKKTTAMINGDSSNGTSTKIYVENSPIRSVITFENGQSGDGRNPNLVIINDTENQQQQQQQQQEQESQVKVATKLTNQTKETNLNNSYDDIKTMNNSRKLSLQLPNQNKDNLSFHNLIKNISSGHNRYSSTSNPDSPVAQQPGFITKIYNSSPPSPTKSVDSIANSTTTTIDTPSNDVKQIEKNLLGSEPNLIYNTTTTTTPVKKKDTEFPSLNDLTAFNFTSLAAQKILKGVGLNSVDTLVELNMTANLDKQNNCDVVHTDFGMF